MNYTAQFVKYVDRDMEDQLARDKKLNFMWKTNYGDQILTNVLKEDDCMSGGIFHDNTRRGKGHPFVGTESFENYNAPDRAIEFLNFVHSWAGDHTEKHVMVPIGC
jgi:hypothetical protein